MQEDKKANSRPDLTKADEPNKQNRQSRSRNRPTDQTASPNPHTPSVLVDALKNLHIASAANVTSLQEPTYECFIQTFLEIGFRKIITMVGAGISTSAGIPDFRSPDKGIYATMLGKYDLPHPQAVFESQYFMEHPSVFYDLAKQVMPSKRKPTKSHYFIKLLQMKGFLLRHYTQNIDGLERLAGITEDKLVEAHGTFQTGQCMKCHATYNYEWIKQEMEANGVPTCVVCDVVIKPDIVFFGESLPSRFYEYLAKDFYEADLLIVMGSSLVVEPFASLVRRVHRNCPRVVINNHEVGKEVGIIYDPRRNERDVFILGTCDEGCQRIVDSMEWTEEFNDLLEEEERKFEGITLVEDFYPKKSSETQSSSEPKVTLDGRSRSSGNSEEQTLKTEESSGETDTNVDEGTVVDEDQQDETKTINE